MGGLSVWGLTVRDDDLGPIWRHTGGISKDQCAVFEHSMYSMEPFHQALLSVPATIGRGRSCSAHRVHVGCALSVALYGSTHGTILDPNIRRNDLPGRYAHRVITCQHIFQRRRLAGTACDALAMAVLGRAPTGLNVSNFFTRLGCATKAVIFLARIRYDSTQQGPPCRTFLQRCSDIRPALPAVASGCQGHQQER